MCQTHRKLMNKEIRELSGATIKFCVEQMHYPVICGHMDCGEWKKKVTNFIIITILYGGRI